VHAAPATTPAMRSSVPDRAIVADDDVDASSDARARSSRLIAPELEPPSSDASDTSSEFRARAMSTTRQPMIWKHDERVVVYPPYIDSTRTTARGRRIALDDCVEHPHPLEMLDACERGLGMKCELEDKCYSRDFWCRGRLRVEWKTEDGEFVNPELNTRGKLLKAIAAYVKKHPERGENGKPSTNPKYMTQHMVFDEYVKQVASAAGPAPGQGKKADKVGNRKKSGKKGRK